MWTGRLRFTVPPPLLNPRAEQTERRPPLLAGHKLLTGRDGDALVFGATAERAFEPSTVRRRARALDDG
jgi:alkanesulfonate monooxygenase SsuD/methylene tetrahydromethanopterin reductase-like flavin-dependent oxidoreductase (luciferase family)